MTYRNVVGTGDNYPLLQLEWAPTTKPTEATQTYVDITTRLREWGWRYGRNDELGEFPPGSGYVLLDNRDRAFDPDYTSGPWHGYIKPRRAFKLTAKIGSTVYGVFVAYARGFPQAWPAYGHDAVVRVDLVDQLAFLATFELPVGFSRDIELSGARVEAVLDAIGYTGASNIQDGTVYMHAINVETAGTSGLGHVRECAAAELGQFFDYQGELRFHDRTERLGLAEEWVSTYTFSDQHKTTVDAIYNNEFSFAFDDTYLVNKVRVDGPDPTTMQAGSAISAAGTADYWPLTKTIPSQLAYEPDRTALAQYEVLRYEQPEYRLPAMTFSLAGQLTDAQRDALLTAGISDAAQVVRTPTGGAIAADQVIEGVGHTCRVGGPWTVTLQSSPADVRVYWTLETFFGALDDPAVVIAP